MPRVRFARAACRATRTNKIELFGRLVKLVLQEKYSIFSCNMRITRMTQLIEQKILSRIYGNGRGWAFSQADFADLGPRPTIDSTLHRREREGAIRRVIRGIYDYPVTAARSVSRLARISIKSLSLLLANLHGASSRTVLQLRTFSDCPLRSRRGSSISPMVPIAPILSARHPSLSNTPP
jgi:hypothetical protein